MGALGILQTVLLKFKAAEKSSIVFFSAIAVQTGFNFHFIVVASQGAIEGITKSLAAELALNIRVYTIAPSLKNTPLAGKLLNTDAKKEANAEKKSFKENWNCK